MGEAALVFRHLHVSECIIVNYCGKLEGEIHLHVQKLQLCGTEGMSNC